MMASPLAVVPVRGSRVVMGSGFSFEGEDMLTCY